MAAIEIILIPALATQPLVLAIFCWSVCSTSYPSWLRHGGGLGTTAHCLDSVGQTGYKTMFTMCWMVVVKLDTKRYSPSLLDGCGQTGYKMVFTKFVGWLWSNWIQNGIHHVCWMVVVKLNTKRYSSRLLDGCGETEYKTLFTTFVRCLR